MSSWWETITVLFWILAGAMAIIVLAAMVTLIGIRFYGYVRKVYNQIKDTRLDERPRRF